MFKDKVLMITGGTGSFGNDDTIIRSPLVVAVDEAMDFVKRNIRLAYEFTGELQRKEVWQYPLPVIRELLLNAVVHRDYRASTDVIIKTTQTDNFFRLHLILNKDSIKDVVKDVIKDVAKDVAKERETFILRIVAKDKDISAQKMSELLNVTLRTIQRDLKKLQEKGILKRIGGRKTGYWKIVKDEK